MRTVDREAGPDYAAAAVLDDRRHVVKFAWSEEAAAGLAREVTAMQILAGIVPIPTIVASSDEPLLLVTERVDGVPLTAAHPALRNDQHRGAVAAQIGTALAHLHSREIQHRLAGTLRAPTSRAPATPDRIRASLRPWVADRQWTTVKRWTVWAGGVLGPSSPTPILVHGDLHGFNQIWSPDLMELRAILDWASIALGEAEFDLRYLPDQVDDHPELVTQVAAHYVMAGGRELDLERIMAWHLLTVLGDALWRSQAGRRLPDGGTPTEWVDRLELRLAELGIDA
jgi:aminoglycoside phosphotransferase (APT) family kinase protein